MTMSDYKIHGVKIDKSLGVIYVWFEYPNKSNVDETIDSFHILLNEKTYYHCDDTDICFNDDDLDNNQMIAVYRHLQRDYEPALPTHRLMWNYIQSRWELKEI